MPGLVEILGAMGRGGDDQMAHVGTGEVVIPNEIIDQNPNLMSAIIKAFVNSGADWRQHMVGGEEDKRNPQTGAREYFFGDDDGGSFFDDVQSAAYDDYSRDIGGNEGVGNTDRQPSISRDPSSFRSNRGVRSSFEGIDVYGDDRGEAYDPRSYTRRPRQPVSRPAAVPSPNVSNDTLGAVGPAGTSVKEAMGMRQAGIPKAAGFALAGGTTGTLMRGAMAGAGNLAQRAFGYGRTLDEQFIGDPGRDYHGDTEPTIYEALTASAPRPAAPTPQPAPAPAPTWARPGAPVIPSYYGLGGMTPLQRRSAFATRAVAGSDPMFRGTEARDLWRTLLQRDLISDGGQLGSYGSVLPIEHQYARHLGLNYEPSTEALLTALAGL